jgi:hypothetical protein
MENRKFQGAPTALRARVLAPFAVLSFLFPMLVFSSVLSGCGAPGEPYERKPPTPMAVTDLTAMQAGNDVVLTFSLPEQAVDRRPLQQNPSIEIYRDIETVSDNGRPHVVATVIPTVLVTIPAAMVDSYVEQGRFRYRDTLHSEDFTKHPDGMAVYYVRTNLRETKPSERSNSVSLRIYPSAVRITDLKIEVTPAAIVLSWTPPEKTIAGATPSITVYHVYRGVPGSAAPSSPGTKLPLAKIADVPAPPFQDTQFEFGVTYVYSVRSVTQYPNAALESTDSNLAEVSPRDTFPPGAPQELVVALVPGQANVPAHLELSWAISSETDIAGYNVYRSEQEGTQGLRITGDSAQNLLLTPAFSDMNVQPGHRYFYSVTAVDHAGNESPASAVVSSDVPAESQP